MIARVRDGAVIPSYQTAGSAGMDLSACLDPDVIVVGPGERFLVPTGIRVAISDGHEGQVRPRSGIALKHGITVLNAPGTIDADYRGEVQVLLYNAGRSPYVVHDGDRIAQLVVAPVVRVEWDVVPDLPDTSRGAGGFGHTGTEIPLACPNCWAMPEWAEPDDEHPYRVIHDVQTCPFRVDVADRDMAGAVRLWNDRVTEWASWKCGGKPGQVWDGRRWIFGL